MTQQKHGSAHLARFYIALICAFGSSALLHSLISFQPRGTLQCVFLLVMAAIGSTWKIVLPGLPGSLSVGYVLVMLGIINLSQSETVLIGLSGALAGTVWRAKVRPRFVQIAFNSAAVVISASAAWLVYHLWTASLASQYRGVELSAAALVYFFFNTASVALVIALTEARSFARVWYSTYFWAFPYYVVGAILAALGAFLIEAYGWPIAVFLLPVSYVIYHSFRLYLNRLESEKIHAQEMADLHFRTVEALALAIEAKDDCTHDHLNRVYVYATEIARELNLAPEEMKALEAAAILHDIGKIAVPDFIISKPGKLTPAEFQKMKIHPVVGAEIVNHVRFPYPVAPLVRGHHEKWNGMGYPDGLSGEQIPLGARILAAVDCFDALSSDRQYRRALPIEKALEIVVNDAGKAFDPRVVEVLKRRAFELEQKAKASAKVALKLSLNVNVERGAAPDAGFEESSSSVQTAATPDRPARTNALASLWPSLAELTTTARACDAYLNEYDRMSMLFARIESAIPHDAAALYVRAGNKLEPRYTRGQDSALFQRLQIPVGSGLSGWVLQNELPIFNGNPAVESAYLLDPADSSNLKSALAIPLVSPDYAAVLALYHANKEAFDRDQLRTLTALAPEILEYLRVCRHSCAPPTPRVIPSSIVADLERLLAASQVEPQPFSIVVVDAFDHSHFSIPTKTPEDREQTIEHALHACFPEEWSGGWIDRSQFVLIVVGLAPQSVLDRLASLQPVLGGRVALGHSCYPSDGETVERLLAEAYRRLQTSRLNRPSMTADLHSLGAALSGAPQKAISPAATPA